MAIATIQNFNYSNARKLVLLFQNGYTDETFLYLLGYMGGRVTFDSHVRGLTGSRVPSVDPSLATIKMCLVMFEPETSCEDIRTL